MFKTTDYFDVIRAISKEAKISLGDAKSFFLNAVDHGAIPQNDHYTEAMTKACGGVDFAELNAMYEELTGEQIEQNRIDYEKMENEHIRTMTEAKTE